MRYQNIIFLIFLILCCMINDLNCKKSIKTIKDTLSLDIDFENISFIQIKGEHKQGSTNSIKSQINKKLTNTKIEHFNCL